MAKAIASNVSSAGTYREQIDATDLQRIDVAFMDFVRVRYRYQEDEDWHRDAMPIIQRARADFVSLLVAGTLPTIGR
jgi:hypothetical protein